MDNAPSLYLVGLGVFEGEHLTTQAVEVLRRAQLVLHLSDKHDILRSINANTVDLGERYHRGQRDWDVYEALASHVVSTAAHTHPVVFATEGNPLFFNDISWEVSRLARNSGLSVEAIPGVSVLDILPIQLGFDIGEFGTQVVEATQLVAFNLQLNPFFSTLIFQVGEFGTSTLIRPSDQARDYSLLVSHLLKFFPGDHPAIFIHSITKRDGRTGVFSTTVQDIQASSARVGLGVTLYLPRQSVPSLDRAKAEVLGIR